MTNTECKVCGEFFPDYQRTRTCWICTELHWEEVLLMPNFVQKVKS